MIPDDEVDRVRELADIVSIIGEHVELKRTGTDYRGPCPFHQGTHRNFSVSPKKRMYYCFVCHEGGDVFAFLQKRLGMDWPSAVRAVAEKSGIALHEVRTRRDGSGGSGGGPDPREPLWEANATAAAYFERVLWEEESGRPAREYLAQREITQELAKRFSLGFAPREIGLMRAYLASLGHDDARQLEAGLLVRREEGDEPRPRFRSRLTFPILDPSGRCAGFGGRVIGTGEPKYLNSAESAVFSKGRLLYNLHQARQVARREDRVILVEGYFDVVRLVAAGIEEVVAPLGTALTTEQAALLTRCTKNVFLLYDSDKAGLKATFRAGDELLREGATVRVVTLPEGEDPDTYVQRQGSEALDKQIRQAIDVFERKVQLLERGGWFSDMHRRREAIDRLLPTIRATADHLLRDMYIGRAAQVSGVDRRVLETEANEGAPSGEGHLRGRRVIAAPPAPGPAPSPPPSNESTRRRTGSPSRRASPTTPLGAGVPAERELVRAMLRARNFVERVAERIGPNGFHEPRYREIFAVLLRLGPDALTDELISALSPESVEALDALLGEPDAIQDMERTVSDSLSRLEERQLVQRNRAIDRVFATATPEEKDRLMAEKDAITRDIARSHASRRT